MKDETQDETSTTKKKNPEDKANGIVLITMDLIVKLGFRVLPDRRLCFAGRTLKGIVLPKNMELQFAIILRLLVWYAPCIEVKREFYRINKACFARRENEFDGKMYLKSLLHLLNSMLPLHDDNQL